MNPARKFQMMVLVILLGYCIQSDIQASAPAQLDTVHQSCRPELPTCADFDAIVFVHGIYGGADTFKNSSTGFDWPIEFPPIIQGRQVDVFRLTYTTALLSWAKGSNPDFQEVVNAAFAAMTPLRKRQYRSIGFIAHSLGGNIVSTYIVMVTERLSHPQRSQNAFIITLATPVLGAQIADLAGEFKSLLGMNDALLASLKNENLYLRMLNEFREYENEKSARYGCRPVHLHAAYEEKYLGPLLVVSPDSAVKSIGDLTNSPIVGFNLNHVQIAKPAGTDDPVYQWVMGRVDNEYTRLAVWDVSRGSAPANRKLCAGMDFIPERESITGNP
ncbi:MAG: hypothetical protein WA657_12355 [Candidatus Acidiferrales bacterium]